MLVLMPGPGGERLTALDAVARICNTEVAENAAVCSRMYTTQLGSPHPPFPAILIHVGYVPIYI